MKRWQYILVFSLLIVTAGGLIYASVRIQNPVKPATPPKGMTVT